MVIINKKLLKKCYVTTWCFEGTPVAVFSQGPEEISLRTAGGREATTGNASTVRRLKGDVFVARTTKPVKVGYLYYRELTLREINANR